MLGNTLRTRNIDAGDDRVFVNVMGNPVKSFDSRGHTITAEYDVLHRLTKKEVTGNSLSNTVEFLEYGEDVTDDTQKNLRGQLYRHWDQSGMTQVSLYDIKGQPRESSKRIRTEYQQEADWPATESARLLLLETETFSSETEYDALGRPTKQYNPDGSETRPEFHQSGKLDKVHIKLKGETSETDFVTGITYNAKGQREKIEYGNDTWTEYTYEDTTFRLTSLKTFRDATPDPVALQDITYIYDPVGNIVKITDDSHNKVFTTTGPVEPIQAYTYDALYRLTDATGRMHTALVNTPFFNDSSSFKQSRHTLLNNQNLIAAYGRSYAYDEVGNLETITQTGTNPFTREMTIHNDSNRGLMKSTGFDPAVDSDWEALGYFDENGNQTRHDHLAGVDWNYRDNISKALIIDRTSDPDDAEYYVYDAGGQRTRKVKETWNGTVVKIDEKIYLGGVEIRRRRDQGSLTNYEDRSSLQVMDDKQRIATVHYWTAHTFSGTYIPALTTNHARYQYGNHLGSASLELDNVGQIISYEEYFPYGGTSFIAGNNQAEVDLKEYRYTAKERDDSTGFYYYGARYYAPWTGRWLSADPAGPVDGLNLYVYVSGNPVKLVDPEGMAGDDVVPSPKKPIQASGAKPNGNEPYSYFLGRQIHRNIELYYKSRHPSEAVALNDVPIVSLLSQTPAGEVPAGTKATKENGLLKKPDIVNFGPIPVSEENPINIYEIKPATGLAEAKVRVELYKRVMSAFGLNVEAGPKDDPGVSGVVPSPNGVAAFFSPVDGVILYRNFPAKKVESPEEAKALVKQAKQEFQTATQASKFSLFNDESDELVIETEQQIPSQDPVEAELGYQLRLKTTTTINPATGAEKSRTEAAPWLTDLSGIPVLGSTPTTVMPISPAGTALPPVPSFNLQLSPALQPVPVVP